MDIKAMAVEAGIDDSAPLTPYMLQRLEVFAQAMARECAEICDENEAGWLSQKLYSHRHGASEDARLIRARFGLEG